MMTSFFYDFGTIVIVTVAYFVFVRRMAEIVHPYRLQMAELGEKLLAAKLPSERAGQIRFYLDNAYSGWFTFAASIVFPFAVVSSAFAKSENLNLTSDERKVAYLFTASVVAANPLFGAILASEFALLGVLLIVFVGPPALMAAVMATMQAEKALRFPRLRLA